MIDPEDSAYLATTRLDRLLDAIREETLEVVDLSLEDSHEPRDPDCSDPNNHLLPQ